MEMCQSLKDLTLEKLEMDEDQIRVLGTCSRPDLEIELTRCKLTNAGSSALAEALGRNQGPTKLDDCHMDNYVLASGLRGWKQTDSRELSKIFAHACPMHD